MRVLRVLVATRGAAAAAQGELMRAGVPDDAIRIATGSDLGAAADQPDRGARTTRLAIFLGVPITLALALCTMIVPGVGYALAVLAAAVIFATRHRDPVTDYREALSAGLVLLVVEAPGGVAKTATEIVRRFGTAGEGMGI
jgi:hypothetical protein